MAIGAKFHGVYYGVAPAAWVDRAEDGLAGVGGDGASRFDETKLRMWKWLWIVWVARAPTTGYKLRRPWARATLFSSREIVRLDDSYSL
jgi:hypothetical protein